MKLPGIRIGLYCKRNGHGPKNEMIIGPKLSYIKSYNLRRIMYYTKTGTAYNFDFFWWHV